MSSTYPSAPGVCWTSPATPSLPAPPRPTGQLTELALPTLVFHSGETFFRKSVQMYVVPLPSERWTIVIGKLGSVAPELILAIAASFQRVILPRNRSASSAPLNFTGVVTPGKLLMGDTRGHTT